MNRFISYVVSLVLFFCWFSEEVRSENEISYKLVERISLYEERFDHFNVNGWNVEGLRIIRDDINYISSKGGNASLRVPYKPSVNGSRRTKVDIPLKRPVDKALLTFKVKFDEEFEFVKGGKLHGLGGGTLTAGCKKTDKLGWTVRIMWLSDGIPALYIYDQKRQSRCGSIVTSLKKTQFQKNVWHLLTLEVNLNSSPSRDDGWVRLSLDGKGLVEVDGLVLTGSNIVGIDTFMFNTFFGGSNKSWSPSKTVYAEFDDIEVVGILSI